MAGQVCRDVPIGLRRIPVRYCQQPDGNFRKSRTDDPGPDSIPASEIGAPALADILSSAGDRFTTFVGGAVEQGNSAMRWGTVALVAVAVLAVVGALFYFIGPIVGALR